MRLAQVQFVKCEPVNGVGKESKRAYTFLKLEGIATDSDGVMSICSFDLWPAKGEEKLPEIKPGKYLPRSEVVIDWKTKQLRAEITGFDPVVSPAKS